MSPDFPVSLISCPVVSCLSFSFIPISFVLCLSFLLSFLFSFPFLWTSFSVPGSVCWSGLASPSTPRSHTRHVSMNTWTSDSTRVCCCCLSSIARSASEELSGSDQQRKDADEYPSPKDKDKDEGASSVCTHPRFSLRLLWSSQFSPFCLNWVDETLLNGMRTYTCVCVCFSVL